MWILKRPVIPKQKHFHGSGKPEDSHLIFLICPILNRYSQQADGLKVRHALQTFYALESSEVDRKRG